MGYRLYFYIVPKEIVAGIQESETLEDAIRVAHPTRDVDEGYVSVYELQGSYQGFEFGKYLDSDHMKHIVGDSKELKWFHGADNDAYVGDMDMVKRAIEWERDRIIDNYKEAASDAEKALKSIQDKIMWVENYLVDLDRDKREVTTSWLYEHQIYNLVLLYKYTDWDKYDVVFAGW